MLVPLSIVAQGLAGSPLRLLARQILIREKIGHTFGRGESKKISNFLDSLAFDSSESSPLLLATLLSSGRCGWPGEPWQ